MTTGAALDDHYVCETCAICRENSSNEKLSKLHPKGNRTLLSFAESRNDATLIELLKRDIDHFIHGSCRRQYTDKRRRVEPKGNVESKKLRSSTPVFDWKTNCLFCGKAAIFDSRHPYRDPVREVRTMEIRSTINKICQSVLSPWSEEVYSRILDCNDLVAVEARYHDNCLRKFTVLEMTDGNNKPGRPVDDDMFSSFNLLCHWLENDGEAELYTVRDLYEQMAKLASAGSKIYTEKQFKNKLKSRYGDHIYFAKIGGSREDVVCFRDMVNFIISDTWYNDRKQNQTLEADRIMVAAGKIIREEIRAHDYSKETYPTPFDIANVDTCRDFLTPRLLKFLETLVKNDLKVSSIGQAITQSVRPRSVISPLLFGLGLEMDLVFGSRWLIDELYSLGFSASYDEIVTYKHSLIQDERSHLCSSAEGKPVQFVADNADSNIKTLDGLGTFHGLGMVKFTKSKYSLDRNSDRVKRQARVDVSDLVKGKGIPIRLYDVTGPSALSRTKLKPIIELKYPMIFPPPQVYYSNLLWQSSNLVRQTLTPTPNWVNWSGFMQHVFLGSDAVDKDEVTILPLMDLDPADETTLYSCMAFVDGEIKKLKLKATTLTFDQPLYVKAEEIAQSKNFNNLVIRLGGFHTLMSAVSAVFSLMRGSGLEEALCSIYGSNAINQILSGKAISRALRALFLLDGALSHKLMEQLISSDQCDLPVTETDIEFDKCKLSIESLDELKELYDDCLSRSKDSSSSSLCEILSSSVLVKLSRNLDKLKMRLESESRTAKLWLQLQNYIARIKNFIASERLKSWEGHLQATTDLLNLFAATGHIHYAKSARLYVQNMRELPLKQPELYQMFCEGLHAVQRSDHVFNGLWTDLVIEQVLMASIKSRGGLTRGRGLTESVRTLWVYTMHMSSQFHHSMTSLTRKKHKTSEQHTELSESRKTRDSEDLQKLISWFDNNNPFDDEIVDLKSLSSGLTASEQSNINCDEAESVGHQIQTQLDHVVFSNATIKRSRQVKTLNDLKPCVKIGDKKLRLDSAILFLRCTAVAGRLDVDVEQYFKYELNPTPSSLFVGNFMRHTDKSDLADLLFKGIPSTVDVPECCTNVVDGGWLLQKVRWKGKSTYRDVCNQYRSYVKNKFKSAVIIFDGYKSSVKDHEHARRLLTVKKRSNDISFSLDNELFTDQSAFLANPLNKENFIVALSSELCSDGHEVKICSNDADTEIVSTALKFAEDGQVVSVVANDTDILVLLAHHYTTGMNIFLHRETNAKRNPVAIYNISDIVERMNLQIRNHLLFIHAWSGCDTTSACYGFGKVSFVKLFLSSERLQQLAKIIEYETDADVVGRAGCDIFCSMYGELTNLTQVRYRRFQKMMTEKNTIETPRIPPTERAAHFHSLRVHLQIIGWRELDNSVLDPCEWGWNLSSDGYIPTQTDLPPAPDNILKYIRCNCKHQKNQCGSFLCSCRKNGLKCVNVCKGCHGEGCKNSERIDLDDDN